MLHFTCSCEVPLPLRQQAKPCHPTRSRPRSPADHPGTRTPLTTPPHDCLTNLSPLQSPFPARIVNMSTLQRLQYPPDGLSSASTIPYQASNLKPYLPQSNPTPVHVYKTVEIVVFFFKVRRSAVRS